MNKTSWHIEKIVPLLMMGGFPGASNWAGAEPEEGPAN